MGLKMIFSILFIFFMFGCRDNYCENVLDLDEVEEVNISPLTTDIDIIPIKCSVPMDGIREVQIFEDYTFLYGLKRKEIYCVKKDTVISILKAVGRGHGEYTYIDDFTYDEKTKIMYVINDEKLLKYSVPSMTFLESLDINYTTIGMMVLNPDEILANCSLWEDDTYKEFYNGLCVVSTTTGKIIKRCFESGFYDGLCINGDDVVRYDGGIMMPVAGIYNNKVISLDINTGTIKDLDCFCYSPKWRLSNDLIKLAKKWDSFNYSMEADKRTAYCDGFHMPAIVNSRLTFWCYPEENGSDRPTVVIKDKDRYIKRHFFVSGTSLRINAYTVKDNRFIKVLCTDPETIITDPENVSDFGKEIYNAMKAQPFNNPILLSFTVDKNI